MKFDVVIVGAGVIGSMICRELTKYDLKTCMLEKGNDVCVGASKANSGIVHGGYEPEPGTLKAKLNTDGVEKLFSTAADLNVPIKRNGSLVCAFGKDEEEHLSLLYERGIVNGIQKLQIIDGDRARELEPMLSEKVSAALYVPTAGIVCPYELTIAAAGNAIDNGATLLTSFEVNAIEKTEEGFTVRSADGRSVECKYVINCAGAYSDKIASLVGDNSFEIIPRAGEYLLLDKNEGKRVSHTIFQVPTSEGKGILVSPTVDGNLLTGPTANKVEKPDNKETTQGGIDTVIRLASKSVPTVAFRSVITSFSGVRSSEKSGDFIIEESRFAPNFINVAAIDSPGLTCSVSIAEYVVELLKEMGMPVLPNPDFNGKREDPHAFKKMTDEEKNEYIKTHPAYGKIVCRCETVTEGEIRDAIKRNPPASDVDGVKRRTRSGMGRCQGGFCMPYVMKLIAEERGISKNDVTKNGGSSLVSDGKI